MQTEQPRHIAADAAALLINASGQYRLVMPENVTIDDEAIVPPHVMYLTAVMMRINDDEFVRAQFAYMDDMRKAAEEERHVFPPAPGTVWKHRKGGTYVVIGIIDDEVGYINLDDPVLRWYRSVEEFMDGRFTAIEDEPTRQFDDVGFKRG